MSATKIGENTTNILKLPIFIINLHFVASDQIFTYRKLNLSLTSSIYFVFLPLEMQKTLINEQWTDKSIPHVFLLCIKRNDQQTFKCSSYKNLFFQHVCYCYNLLRLIFFILRDKCKTLLFMKVCRYSEIFLSAMLLLFPQYQHQS